MTALARHEAEFSRVVDVEGLGEDELQRKIDATQEEREALARRFGLIALDKLTAIVHLRKAAGHAVDLRAEFEADVVQACVVTLEPVPAHIAERFELTFAPQEAPQPGEEIDLSATDEDVIEPLLGGEIDVGEAVSQHLALALDPYPRAPGVTFEPSKYPGLTPKSPETGPFSALASLRKRGQN
jgi:uncharacterized metal-binding protein YceD (DUF177 family)